MMANSGTLALSAWLLPALSFLVLAIVYPLRRLGKPAAWFSIFCAGAAFASAVMAWRIQSVAAHPVHLVWAWLPSGGKTIADVGVLVDAQSTIMLCLVSLVSLLVQFYSVGYLHDEPAPAFGRYYAYQSLFAFSMMGLALAPNLLQLFMCWELVGLCSYLLIGYWYQRPSAARAAVKAFWITKAGDVGMLVGIVMLYRLAGTFDLTELHSLAATNALPLAGLSIITFCLYLGAMGKSAQFPFHVWLPDAMEGPTPVSALIHAATMVTAGVYLLFRTAFLFEQTPDVLAAVGWIGAFTALLAATLACVQSDIKRVLADFLTAFYMFRVVFIAFLGAPAVTSAGHGGHGEAPAHDAPAIMALPLWILAALAMGIGIWFSIAHPEAEFVPPGWLTPLAVGVAGGGSAFAPRLFGPPPVRGGPPLPGIWGVTGGPGGRFLRGGLFSPRSPPGPPCAPPAPR